MGRRMLAARQGRRALPAFPGGLAVCLGRTRQDSGEELTWETLACEPRLDQALWPRNRDGRRSIPTPASGVVEVSLKAGALVASGNPNRTLRIRKLRGFMIQTCCQHMPRWDKGRRMVVHSLYGRRARFPI
jgi:hypothetical protein